MNNPVYDLFKQSEYKDKKFSLNTLGKKLGINKKMIRFYIEQSNHIVLVKPNEVGSLKELIYVYKYVEDYENYNEPNRIGTYLSKSVIRNMKQKKN